MFLEGLLGGLGGLTDAYSNVIQQRQAKTLKTDEDKQKFQQDVLKGIILQQMKPKGGNFNWEDMVSDGGGISDLIDPAFLKKISTGLKAKARTGGGGGGGFNPFGPGPGPAPKPQIFPNGGVQIQIK